MKSVAASNSSGRVDQHGLARPVVACSWKNDTDRRFLEYVHDASAFRGSANNNSAGTFRSLQNSVRQILFGSLRGLDSARDFSRGSEECGIEHQQFLIAFLNAAPFWLSK